MAPLKAVLGQVESLESIYQVGMWSDWESIVEAQLTNSNADSTSPRHVFGHVISRAHGSPYYMLHSTDFLTKANLLHFMLQHRWVECRDTKSLSNFWQEKRQGKRYDKIS